MSKTRFSVFLILARLIALLLQLFAFRVYVKILGKEQYDVVLFGTLLVGYLGLLNFGVYGATQKRLSEFAHQGDDESYSYELSQGFVMVTLLQLGSCAVAAMGYVTAQWFGYSFQGLTLPIFMALAIQFGMNQHFVFSSCVLSATDRFSTLAGLNVLQSFLSVSLSLTWVLVQPRIESLAYGLMTASTITAIAAVIASHSWSQFLKGRSFWNRGISKELINLGKRFYVSSVMVTVNSTVDRLLVGAVAPRGFLTTFAMGAKVPELLLELLRPLTQTVQPELTRQQISDQKRFAASAVSNTLLGVGLGCSFIAIPSAFSGCILTLWFGAETLPGAEHVGFAFGLAKAFDLGIAMLAMAFFAKGEPHRLVGYVGFNAVATILFTLPAFHYYGLLGVATMDALIFLVQYVPLIYTTRKWVAEGVDVKEFLVKTHVMFAATIVASIGLHFGVDGRLSQAAPLAGVALGPLTAVIWVWILSKLCLFPVPDPIKRRLMWLFGKPADQSQS